MTAPTPTFSYPRRTKVIIVAVLAVAIGGFVLAGLTADTDNPDAGIEVSGEGGAVGGDAPAALGRGVERVLPRDGAESVLQQSEIVLDLAPGWVGELVYAPSDGDALALPGDEIDEVPELDQFTYVPGPDKTLERLASNDQCVIATIWSRVEGRAASERVVQWCFSVV